MDKLPKGFGGGSEMSNDEFTVKLSGLVALTLKDADAETTGVMIERLSAALGLVICEASKGNKAAIDSFIMGVEGYIFEEAMRQVPFVSFMNAARSLRPNPTQ